MSEVKDLPKVEFDLDESKKNVGKVYRRIETAFRSLDFDTGLDK